MTANGTAPAPRFGHVATYDSNSNRMTVFGGGLGTPGTCTTTAWVASTVQNPLEQVPLDMAAGELSRHPAITGFKAAWRTILRRIP